MTEDDVAALIGDRLGERVQAFKFPPFRPGLQRGVDFRLGQINEGDLQEAIALLLEKWAPASPSAYRIMTVENFEGDLVTRLDTWAA